MLPSSRIDLTLLQVGARHSPGCTPDGCLPGFATHRGLRGGGAGAGAGASGGAGAGAGALDAGDIGVVRCAGVVDGACAGFV